MSRTFSRRARAGVALAALPEGDRVLLERYAAGVNAGLAGLAARPFEYGVLRATPRPWVAQDTLLVVWAMYFDLQEDLLHRVFSRGWLRDQGTTAEQLAMVAVIEREHAARTPGAQMTAPITVDDVLNSGWVTTPYHKLDCSLISDGGAAFIVTSAERARALGVAKPVYILGGGECYTHEHIFLMPSLTTTGAVRSSAKAYAMAGCTPAEIDVAGVYDCFTGTVIMNTMRRTRITSTSGVTLIALIAPSSSSA